MPSAGGIFQFALVGRAVKKGAMMVDRSVVGSCYPLEINGFGPCVVSLRVQKKLHPSNSVGSLVSRMVKKTGFSRGRWGLVSKTPSRSPESHVGEHIIVCIMDNAG